MICGTGVIHSCKKTEAVSHVVVSSWNKLQVVEITASKLFIGTGTMGIPSKILRDQVGFRFFRHLAREESSLCTSATGMSDRFGEGRKISHHITSQHNTSRHITSYHMI